MQWNADEYDEHRVLNKNFI